MPQDTSTYSSNHRSECAVLITDCFHTFTAAYHRRIPGLFTAAVVVAGGRATADVCLCVWRPAIALQCRKLNRFSHLYNMYIQLTSNRWFLQYLLTHMHNFPAILNFQFCKYLHMFGYM